MQRFNRRTKVSMSNTVATYNQMDMNQLFKENIFSVGVPIRGETDDYIVTIAFGDFLGTLQEYIKNNNDKLDVKSIVRAIVECFNRDDVYIGCSCPDFRYRFNYFAQKNKFNALPPETRPSNITNPHDTLGSACKHVLCVLNNTKWILKVASVIYNYINYMKQFRQKQYADIIYPAIYGKPYKDDVQLDISDDNTLSTSSSDIDTTNRFARNTGKFTKGNTQGVRFAPTNKDQIDIDTEQ